VIRLGTTGIQTATFIAGIVGTHVTGRAVYVTSTGRLGVLAPSERYKTAIASMGSSSSKLQHLLHRRDLALQQRCHALRTNSFVEQEGGGRARVTS
jgi:hypothetical protein